MAQGCICITISLGKIDIYMKFNINMKKKTCQKYGIQVKMYESSKVDYTSTSNGYK